MNLLLVEDERKLSTLLKQLLEDERYAVDIAADGERAQELAETARYDAIILDLMIPKKDGMEVCRWLRQNRLRRAPRQVAGAHAERAKERPRQPAAGGRPRPRSQDPPGPARRHPN